MVQHEHEHAKVGLAGLDRRLEQVALAEVDVRESLEPLASSRKHRGLAVDGDHAPDHGREPLRRLAGAAAEVDGGRARRQQAEQRLGDEGLAEQLAPQLVPVAADPPEERAAVHLARGQHLGKPGVVLLERGGGAQVLPAHPPELAHVGAERRARHAVEALRALGALGDPALLEERLQVPAHGALRQLHGARQFAHAELLALEEPEDPQAREVAERPQPAQPALAGARRFRLHRGSAPIRARGRSRCPC